MRYTAWVAYTGEGIAHLGTGGFEHECHYCVFCIGGICGWDWFCVRDFVPPGVSPPPLRGGQVTSHNRTVIESAVKCSDIVELTATLLANSKLILSLYVADSINQ